MSQHDNDGCITFVLIAVSFAAIGFAVGTIHGDAAGIDLGTVTATAGMLTVTGEATLLDGADGPVLVVVEQQGAVESTSILREWTLVERATTDDRP
jgi:hypothetical protein